MATERAYVIRVSAILDRSTAAAVGDAVQQWDRVTRASGRSARDQQNAHERAQRHVAGIRDRYFRDQQRIEEKAGRDAERIRERTANNAARVEKQASDRIERESAARARREAREHERAQDYVARIKDRHFRDEQRRDEQRSRQTDQARRQRVKEIASDAYQTAAAVGRKALGVAGEITGGLGIDFSLNRGVSKAVELEKMAVAITNSGNRGTGGAAGAAERAAQPAELQALARGIGDKYKIDPTKVLAGLGKYQALTGDLETGKAGLNDLAGLAKAFNVDLDKMVASAGQVGSAIGEVGKEFATPEEKAKAVVDVLKTLTAQGQEGAIEIGDMAVQMAALKAAGGRFEGSTSESIKKMGALAQLSMQLGGSKNAAQASTAVMGFANTLATPARRAAFKAAGVDVDSATQKGAFADPFEIIRRSLLATGGAQEPMKKLFANVIGERAVTALTKSFNAAGGGAKGIAAVDEQFKRFGGSVTDDQINENLGRALNTKESKAQEFQNRIDKITASLADKVLPSLEKMAPAAEKVVAAFAKVIEWTAENPGSAITAAIVGSIAKAAIGNAVKDVLTRLLAGGGGAGVPGGAGGAPGVLGKAGAVAAAGVGGFLVGKAIAEHYAGEVGQGTSNSVGQDMAGANALGSAQRWLKGDSKRTAPEVMNELARATAMTEERLKGAMNPDSYVWGALPGTDSSVAKASQQQDDQAKIPELKAELAAMKAAITAMTAKLGAGITVNGSVTVDNMPAGGPNQKGRQGIDDDGG